jgi:hypothetical protein
MRNLCLLLRKVYRVKFIRILLVCDETLHGNSLENELILKDFGHNVGKAIAPCGTMIMDISSLLVCDETCFIVFSESGHQFKPLLLLDLRLTFSSLSDFRSGLRFGTFVFICLAVSVTECTNFVELQGVDFELIFPIFIFFCIS